jgi:argininosuccinate synthase
MDIRKILKKVEKTETPKVNKVAVAYSGGLDSSLAIELLRRKYKTKKILPITIDVGQGEGEIIESQRKAKILKIRPLFFDLRKEFTEGWIARAIQANSDYMGYPVSTSMTRQIVRGRWQRWPGQRDAMPSSRDQAEKETINTVCTMSSSCLHPI